MFGAKSILHTIHRGDAFCTPESGKRGKMLGIRERNLQNYWMSVYPTWPRWSEDEPMYR